MGLPRAVELSLNESGAQPLTLSRSERLELGPRSGFGFLAPPVRNGSRGGGGGGAASVGGGAGSARPQDMAHNKIPPRWLNCPRRGQPVAGNPAGDDRASVHWRVPGRAVCGAQLSVFACLLVVFQD